MIRGWSISCKIVISWMSLDLTNITLVQVMAWCHQAASHYLNQCWPRYVSSHGINRPQWVNSSPPSAEFMSHWIWSALVQIMACCLECAKPLSEPMLTYCQSGNIFQWNFIWNWNIFIQENASEHVICEMAAILSRGDELTNRQTDCPYEWHWWRQVLTVLHNL